MAHTMSNLYIMCMVFFCCAVALLCFALFWCIYRIVYRKGTTVMCTMKMSIFTKPIQRGEHGCAVWCGVECVMCTRDNDGKRHLKRTSTLVLY